MNCDCNEIFSPKDPGERVILSFRYKPTLQAQEQLSGITLVSVAVVAGEDANPQSLLDGPAAIDIEGRTVRLPVDRGVLGVTYRISVTCTTTEQQRFTCAGNIVLATA